MKRAIRKNQLIIACKNTRVITLLLITQLRYRNYSSALVVLYLMITFLKVQKGYILQ